MSACRQLTGGTDRILAAIRHQGMAALLTVVAGCRGDVAPEVPVPARAVIAPAAVSIAGIGRTATLLATVTDSRGRAMVDPPMTWQSSSPAVALAEGAGGTGTVTAVAPGSAVVTATSTSGTAVASAVVTVSAEIRSVTLGDSVVSLDLVSRRTRVMTARATADDGVVASYRWSVSAPGVVSLAADTGTTVTLVANRVGAAMVTVRSRSQFGGDERTATLRVEVIGTVFHLAVDPPGARLVRGQTQLLTARLSADSGADTRVTWRSSDPSVAAVAASGLVTAVGPGSTHVLSTSVADPSKRDSASITVTDSPVFQAVTNWETVRAPPMPGAGGRWFAHIFDLAYTPSGTALVLADCGLFLRNGTAFTRHELRDVRCLMRAVSSGPHLVVVGGRGDVYRWNGGTTFSKVTQAGLPEGFRALDVWIAPGGEVIAIGGDASSGSTLYVLLNGAWVAAAPPSPVPMLAVSGAALDDLFATGANGDLLRYHGARWVTVGSLPTGSAGASIWSPGGGDYYIAAGTAGAWRLTGTTLTRLSTTSTTQVRGTSASDVLFVRECGLDRWNGATMQDQYVGVGLGNYCYTPSVVAASGGEVTHAVNGLGTVLAAHPRTAAGVGPVVRLSSNPDLRGVAASSRNHAIAVGEWGYVASWNGTTWRSDTVPGHRMLYGVTSLGPTQTWAAGDGVFSHDGTTWQMVDGRLGLMDIWATDARNIWAVGLHGTVLRFDGSTWTVVPVGTSAHLRAVWGTGPPNMFIGGDGGLLLRFDGKAFHPMDPAVTDGIYSIHGAGNDLWIGTGAQSIRRFDGRTWSSMTGFSKVVAYSLWVNSPHDVYASGGCVHRFEGGTFWRNLACPLSYGITGLPDGGAIAAGGGGALWLGRTPTAGFGSAGTTPAGGLNARAWVGRRAPSERPVARLIPRDMR